MIGKIYDSAFVTEDVNKKVVHVKIVTCFMVDLPVDMKDGGMETVSIIASQSDLRVISQNAVAGLDFMIELTKGGSSV